MYERTNAIIADLVLIQGESTELGPVQCRCCQRRGAVGRQLAEIHLDPLQTIVEAEVETLKAVELAPSQVFDPSVAQTSAAEGELA